LSERPAEARVPPVRRLAARVRPEPRLDAAARLGFGFAAAFLRGPPLDFEPPDLVAI
jgi:hypothetical protein